MDNGLLPVRKNTLRTAQMIRAVSLPPITLQADDPFTMLFDPFRVGCAVHHSKSCSCDGSAPAGSLAPKCFSVHSSNVVPSFCSLHGAPVPINETKTYGDFAMARGCVWLHTSKLENVAVFVTAGVILTAACGHQLNRDGNKQHYPTFIHRV